MSDQVLNAVEAARRIYDTARPSAEQVGRVVKKIESGVLHRGPHGGATTTVQAVAEYLARRETSRATAHVEGRRKPTPPGAAKSVQRPVAALYHELLKDYFLAVLMRRRTTNRSHVFRWAVTGTQALILGLAIYALGTVAAARLRQRVIPPEEKAVQSWLTQRFTDVDVKRIEILDDSSVVQAKFSYRVNNRRIHSSLLLTLRDGRVVNVESGPRD